MSWSPKEGTRLVGQAAKNQAAANPKNTVNDAKRLIGRGFHDAGLQKDLQQLGYCVEEEDSRPRIKVVHLPLTLTLTLSLTLSLTLTLTLTPNQGLRGRRGVPHLLHDHPRRHARAAQARVPHVPPQVPRGLPVQVVQLEPEVQLPAVPEHLLSTF